MSDLPPADLHHVPFTEHISAPDLARVAVVVNGAARRGAGAGARVVAMLREAGLTSVALHEVGGGAELASTLDAVVDDPAGAPDLLVVGGGDGSVSCAAARVAGRPIVLGVLPLGTANDLARTLEVPNDLAAAVDTVARGKVVDVDLGRVDGRAFLNVASMGLSVGVTEQLSPGLKRRLGPLAYPVATLRAFRRLAPFSARLEFPDGDHDTVHLDDLLQVAVGNGRHYGGGNTVAPAASIDDHLLDVYAIRRGRLRDHVSVARFLKDGSFVEHESVLHLTTRRLRVVTTPGLPVNLDGEIAAHTPSRFSVEPDAVRVVVPHHSSAARLDAPGR